jgi:phosphoglycerate dehydrogenase-like enzyme
VNIARGRLLDYEAVVKHLESGHLGGLGTDVAWTEPFDPDDRILKFKNVIMTPHIAGVTEHSYRSMAKVCVAGSYSTYSIFPLLKFLLYF